MNPHDRDYHALVSWPTADSNNWFVRACIRTRDAYLANARTSHLSRISQAIVDREPKRVLEIGSGPGQALRQLERRFNDETSFQGIDLAPAYGVNSMPDKISSMNAMDLKFEDASFDFVFMIHALEHIEDSHLAEQEITRVLEPGGWFVSISPIEVFRGSRALLESICLTKNFASGFKLSRELHRHKIVDRPRIESASGRMNLIGHKCFGTGFLCLDRFLAYEKE